MKFKILILLSIVLLSCKVTFVPTKSPTAIASLAQIQKDANAAFSSLTYNEALYLVVDADISNLITFDKTRVKSGTILKQDASIQKLFTEYEGEHKVVGTIVTSVSNDYKKYFKSVVDPRIVSENALK